MLLVVGGIGMMGARLLYDAASEERFAPLREKLVAMEPLPIRHVVINGRGMTSEESIYEALGTSLGRPIFGFSVEAARKRIDELPFVDHATVERRMPDTVIINLTERTPVAVWQTHGHFTLINRAGEEVPDQGLTGKNAQAFLQLPLVVGDGANMAASSVIDALAKQPDVKSRVTALVRVGNRRWNVTLKDGTTVLLPEGEEAAAFARLARYQGTMQLLDRPVVSIDMRLPDRMVIHQTPAPSPPPDAANAASAKPEAAKSDTSAPPSDSNQTTQQP
ncbi:cell division protein FtsQ [Gluconobacter frateurii NRIC 0228]|uniref:Cell division protein FtsQ n=1 Tax=Gluconobacter frateurii NRIC 0228 TaxID=1307946 RepID=A0ABQ0QDI7_9PROT|nr:cell division protein FtsQ [Gluconobacter frateurii NRIC 0228]